MEIDMMENGKTIEEMVEVIYNKEQRQTIL